MATKITKDPIFEALTPPSNNGHYTNNNYTDCANREPFNNIFGVMTEYTNNIQRQCMCFRAGVLCDSRCHLSGPCCNKSAICLSYCNYGVVKEVAKELGMKVVQYADNWDLCWSDTAMDIKTAKQLKTFQKMNHFLGVSEISRKDSLARNLNAMTKCFLDDYNFFPKTWYLPIDYSKLKAYWNQHRTSTYILKPSAGSRGIGIYLYKSIKNINQFESTICQLYVANPLLIDGFKFDIRVYILLASCDPLKIFVYNDGIVRLATEPYKKPTRENLKNVYMHLTNYSVNKNSKNYDDNEVSGSKRRITALNKHLANEGHNVEKIWNEIDDIIIKTIILAYPFVNRTYKTCFTGHKYIPACFEILGFDILLDDNCKPHLLEVNHSPDLNTPTKIDKMVKRELLKDTFRLLQLDKSFQKIVTLDQKWKIEHTLNADKPVYKQRIIECQKKFEQHNNAWESKNMGNYRLVYSKENEKLYDRFFYQNESTLYQKTLRPLVQKESSKRLQKQTKADAATIGKMKKIVVKKPISQQLVNNTLFGNSVSKTLFRTKLPSIPNQISRHHQIIREGECSASCEDPDDEESNGQREIDIIKKMNQKKYPHVRSCLFRKFSKKKGCFSDGWKDSFIDQIEEDTRVAYMTNRTDLIFKLGIKDQIYYEFKSKNHLSHVDHVDYAEYQKKKEISRIKPLLHYNVLNITLIE